MWGWAIAAEAVVAGKGESADTAGCQHRRVGSGFSAEQASHPHSRDHSAWVVPAAGWGELSAQRIPVGIHQFLVP